jgi:carbon monoxide dehydrogenase subunit G
LVPRSPYFIDYEGGFDFPLSPDELWEKLEHIDRFEPLLGWLSAFRLEGDGLQAGSVLSGVITPPLPYRMRLRVDLDECEPPSCIVASVHGDLEGDATLHLLPTAKGCRVTVTWTVEMMQRSMRAAARIAYPLLRWGHDRVVEATVRGFRRYLSAP